MRSLRLNFRRHLVTAALGLGLAVPVPGMAAEVIREGITFNLSGREATFKQLDTLGCDRKWRSRKLRSGTFWPCTNLLRV